MIAPLPYNELINKVKNCTACEACMASCPKAAIEMQEDGEGFLRPFIHSDVCIGCKKCLNICPVINDKTGGNGNVILPLCYGAIHKDEAVLLKSSSGGAFSALAQEIFQRGGSVYGAAFQEDGSITHTKAHTFEDIRPMRGAKYAHSSAANAYKLVKEDLKNGLLVLFTGTPCQMVGLKQFLGHKLASSDLLYTCDIICHGMMPSKLYNEYLEYHSKVGDKVKKVDFRFKEKGVKGTRCRLIYESGKEIIIPNKKDYYHDALVSDFCLRESCYNCPAARLPRAADITIGDFWGVKEVLPHVDDTAGISVIFFHSDKAKRIIQDLENNMRMWPVDFKEAIKCNPSFWYSPLRYPIREQFLRRLKKRGYKGSVLYYFNRSPLKSFAFSIARKALNLLNVYLKRK